MAGRYSKGERHLMASRPPKAVADLVIERATKAGATYSDYIASVLAEHVGLPELAPLPPEKLDQELPMTG